MSRFSEDEARALADRAEDEYDERLLAEFGEPDVAFSLAPGVALLLRAGLRYAVLESLNTGWGKIERTVVHRDRLVELRRLLGRVLDADPEPSSSDPF